MEQNDVLSVIRPLPGIESNKYQPIIRQINNIKISITPSQISPITKRIYNSSHVQQPKILLNQASDPPRDDILLFDQQEAQKFTNQEMQTSLELHFAKEPLVPHLHSQPNELLSLYSDDYYDQFVRKIFDDNPMLDKKTLVAKLLNHLQV